jgi:hypothetical protein
MVPRPLMGEKVDFSANGYGKTRYARVKLYAYLITFNGNKNGFKTELKR